MKRSIGLWQLMGFAVTSLGGTLLHFLYDLTGKAIWVAPFSGVNESTWEHMKLLFWPLLILAWVQQKDFKEFQNYWCIKLLSILVGLFAIPMLYYTYNGMFGKSPDWVNIAIFYVAAGLAFLLEWYLFQKNSIVCKHSAVPLGVVLFLGLLFILFTFFPPRIPLFQDPVTGTYGIHN